MDRGTQRGRQVERKRDMIKGDREEGRVRDRDRKIKREREKKMIEGE